MQPEKQTFPHNVDAEKSVLSACMLNEDWAKFAIPQLSKEHFHVLTHQSVFIAMFNLMAKGRPVDIVSVRDYLRSKGSAVKDSELLSLNDNSFSLTSCKWHLDIVKRCELQRRLVKFAVELKAMAETSQEDIESVRKQALDMLIPLICDYENDAVGDKSALKDAV